MFGVDFGDSALEALTGADACIVVTEWPEFAELDWNAAAEAMKGRVVIDGRNFVDSKAIKASGFAYEGIGR
jgi:UDPglucose 6-dehydrogenase